MPHGLIKKPQGQYAVKARTILLSCLVCLLKNEGFGRIVLSR
jgi:hypothetical protein